MRVSVSSAAGLARRFGLAAGFGLAVDFALAAGFALDFAMIDRSPRMRTSESHRP
jgi:hypothetical protein